MAVSAFSNADYFVQMWKGQIDSLGSPLAHVGFALTIFGAVISTAQKDIISQNRIGDISTLNEELNNATDRLVETVAKLGQQWGRGEGGLPGL